MFYTQNFTYTVSPQKTCDYIFYNNFNNKCPITIIFGIVKVIVKNVVTCFLGGHGVVKNSFAAFVSRTILAGFTLIRDRVQRRVFYF